MLFRSNLLTGVHTGGHAQGDVLVSIEDLKGSALLDSLTGNASANALDGGAGSDTLAGGQGNDTLTGGSDADRFVFDTGIGVNVDVVQDLVSGTDDIVLDNDVFTQLSVGTLSADNFVSGSGAAAADADDYIVYDTDSGLLYYDLDGSGGGTAVSFAQLANLAGLTADDIQVVD